MITPEPRDSMSGSRMRSRRTAASRFRPSARRHSSSSESANPPAGADEPPTAWTMISTPPSRSRTASPPQHIPLPWPDQPANNTLRKLGWLVSSGDQHRRAGIRSRAATAAPMPCVPPVTSARRPASCRSSLTGGSPVTRSCCRRARRRIGARWGCLRNCRSGGR